MIYSVELGLVKVVAGLYPKFVKILVHPSNAFVEATAKVDSILPAKFVAQLGAVEMVGRILTQALTDDFNVIRKAYI